MIEGGYNLLNNVKNKIDYLVLFVSHKDTKLKQYSIDEKEFEVIYSYFINNFDEIIFLKKVNGK